MSAVLPAADAFPTPADRPEADVVIYDGECKFCTGWVRKLHRYDRRGKLTFLSLHDPEVTRRWPDLTHDELMKYIVLVTADGRRYRGAEAIKYLSTRLPGIYWVAPFLHLPFTMPFWQLCYRTFAKRRYRWGRIESCDNGTCKIPPRR